MKKRFALTALLTFLLVFSAFSCLADSQRVFDKGDLFTQEEEASLEAMIADFASEYGMDFVLLTSTAKRSVSMQKMSDDFYDNGGFGIGSDHSGFLFCVDLSDFSYYLTTTGKAIDIMTDSRLEAFQNTVVSALSKAKRGSSTYAEAFETAIRAVEKYVKQGVPAGQYRYSTETGEILTSPVKRLTLIHFLISAGIGLLAGGGIAFGTISSYKLKHSTYRYDYAGNSELEVTHRRDDYLRTQHTRTRIYHDEGGHGGHGGGGSGTHSSGGESHGGGGGHF